MKTENCTLLYLGFLSHCGENIFEVLLLKQNLPKEAGLQQGGRVDTVAVRYVDSAV